jgi:outer membrane lipoprotein LolB
LQGLCADRPLCAAPGRQNYAGRLHWRHDGDRDELLLSSPLGQGMAEIVSDASGARLTASDGNSHTAATADELLQSVLGYPCP